MRRPPPTFDQKQGAVLKAMYEVANGTYDSYALAWKLNPNVEVGTPPAGQAFAETRDATEQLIVQGLVRGKRLVVADGVFFQNLRLTPKGEQAAINYRNQAEELARALPEFIQDADRVTKEMNEGEEKQKNGYQTIQRSSEKIGDQR